MKDPEILFSSEIAQARDCDTYLSCRKHLVVKCALEPRPRRVTETGPWDERHTNAKTLRGDGGYI